MNYLIPIAPDDEPEIPITVADAIASWERTLHATVGDRRVNLERACTELWRLSEQCTPEVYQVIVDEMQILSEIAEVDPEEAQKIIARAKNAPRGLAWIDMSTWDTTPVPPREWAVRDRIPMRQPTLFSGEGAAGKTLLELQLCAAHVLGRDWIGSMPEPGPALYIGAEDDQEELRRRMTAVAAHYQVTFDELIKNGLRMKSFAGDDMLLGVPDRSGKIIPTPLFDELLKEARDVRPKHIGIDTSADAYGGDEIDRAQVRQFVGLLRKLAIAANGSVVLLSHPSLTGINTGSGLSGSTGWHNSVRARMYLRSPAPADGEQPDSDVRELQFMKNNYGPKAESTVLRYRDGMFQIEAGLSGLDRMAREGKTEQAFLDMLKRFDREDLNVSNKPRSPNFAPAAFAGEPEAKDVPARKADLEAAMRRLLSNGKVVVEPYGRAARGYSRLVLK